MDLHATQSLLTNGRPHRARGPVAVLPCVGVPARAAVLRDEEGVPVDRGHGGAQARGRRAAAPHRQHHAIAGPHPAPAPVAARRTPATAPLTDPPHALQSPFLSLFFFLPYLPPPSLVLPTPGTTPFPTEDEGHTCPLHGSHTSCTNIKKPKQTPFLFLARF